MRFVASVLLSTLLLGQRRFARAENFTPCHGVVADSASNPVILVRTVFLLLRVDIATEITISLVFGDQPPRETTSELVKINPKP
jgi:hypothetical protein